MEPVQHFKNEVTWTATEKKIARRTFDKAFERHCTKITEEARRMLENVSAPSDIWRVQEYLSEKRKTVDRIYQYRYSDLLLVFARLGGGEGEGGKGGGPRKKKKKKKIKPKTNK